MCSRCTFFIVLQLVPIIASVSVKALNLSEVQVNITLLTDGGQSVEYYEVSGSEVFGAIILYTYNTVTGDSPGC
jgi:hypothetical protein